MMSYWAMSQRENFFNKLIAFYWGFLSGMAMVILILGLIGLMK